MEQTWRWFGEGDPVPLAHARQAGATGIVTALHHIPNGEVWPVAEIAAVRDRIAAAGMRWAVVESVPVSEDIKTRTGDFRRHLDNYAQTIRNLAAAGIDTVCYNFMPVLDWTRTDLSWALPDGGRALRFDADHFAAFDLFILRRPGAEADHTPDRVARAAELARRLSDGERDRLTRTVLAGLPGAEETYGPAELMAALSRYDGMGAEGLFDNLAAFLRHVTPVAEEVGVRLGIHPDDPPRPLLGLPRIVSTATDCRRLLGVVDSPANGLTFCAGCYGVRADNDLPAMVDAFGDRINFVHLRATKREADPESFHEAPHLDGDVDMVALISALTRAERRREAAGRADAVMPMRPDHGHQILDDLDKNANPGYSAIGRLKGLAELRGVMRAVERLS